MKDTGKTLNGIKVYSDPECPPDTLFMLNGNYIDKPTERRTGKLVGVGWHEPTSRDSLLYKLAYNWWKFWNS